MNGYLQNKTIFTKQIHSRISLNLGLVVVIPAFDEPFLLLSLMNLKKCELPSCDVEVIVIINDSEKTAPEIKEANFQLFKQADAWAKANSKPRLKFHILYFPDNNAKHAGVGLARKTGMDEACWRFEKIKNKKGIIACFDADSKVDSNYFVVLENHFKKHRKSVACSVYFEHPTGGADFDPQTYEAIIAYELHLRYFIEYQRVIGFPFAFHTIGSSMAVRSDAYQKQGGMNRRQAGEDFYFLQKFIELGNFKDCNETRVIPSPRPSHRVPFGTGKAVQGILNSKGKYETYSPESFEDLKLLFKKVKLLYEYLETDKSDFIELMPEPVAQFLNKIKFESRVEEIHLNTTNFKTFKSRFYRWFNAFMLMKYLHFARDNFYPNIEVEAAAAILIEKIDKTSNGLNSGKDYLTWFRKRQRN